MFSDTLIRSASVYYMELIEFNCSIFFREWCPGKKLHLIIICRDKSKGFTKG